LKTDTLALAGDSVGGNPLLLTNRKGHN
jgi:hypothetical protein